MAGFTESIKNLLIPRKSTPVGQPAYETDCRAIEIWAQQAAKVVDDLIAFTNGLAAGGYASLTGPGQTNPTGALTQHGPFAVADTTTGSTGIVFSTLHGPFTVNSSAGASIQDTSGNGVSVNATVGPVRITAAGAIASLSGVTAALGSTAGNTTIRAVGGTVLIQAPAANGVEFETQATLTFFFASTLGTLPAGPPTDSWGFTATGHIYFYPSGGPWTLVI